MVAEPKGKDASGSGVQDKGKGVADDDEDDVDDIEDMVPIRNIIKTKHSAQEIKQKVTEAINKENAVREANVLNQRKLMFPLWTLERLRKEVIEAPSSRWIELVLPFNVENSKDSQFDMPITRKAFIFHCFTPIVAIPSPDLKVDQGLLEYYHEFSQLQYLT